jgi:cbb3-type cytochrome c oxidase subunit III
VASGLKAIQGAAIVAVAAGIFVAYQSAERPIQAATHGPAFLNPIQAPAQTPTAAAQAQAETNVPAAAKPVEDNPGTESYAKHCAICHGDQREGILPAFPPLLGINHQLKDEQIVEIIHKGKGRMPGFPTIKEAELTGLLHYLSTSDMSTPNATTAAAPGRTDSEPHATGLAEAGGGLFQQNCAFCHGRDTMGGETGPDLTSSKLVLSDTNGDKISEVVRNGRPEKKMPAFNFSSQELLSLAAYIHAQGALAASKKGGRRGVTVADLQTGNVESGKAYFNGAGGCSKCHSPTGDLAGVATRFEGLKLEERMLYPSGVKSRVTVTLPSGKKMNGTLAYQDEFHIGLKDSEGTYHSWPVEKIKFNVVDPLKAHEEQFPKYTDDDVHNLMAYIQTLK